jgi:hypothetical protein
VVILLVVVVVEVGEILEVLADLVVELLVREQELHQGMHKQTVVVAEVVLDTQLGFLEVQVVPVSSSSDT